MEIFLAVIGLLGSFYFAGAEAAFTTFNKIHLDIWKKQNRKLINSAIYFRSHPEDFFSTVLIGNNLANILYTTFATVFLIQYIDEAAAWLLITAIVLLGGEIFPKIIFWSMADSVILPVLFFAKFFYFLFKPIIISINNLLEHFLRLFKISHTSTKDYFSRAEIEHLIAAGFSGLDKYTYEQKYITNVLDFADSVVRQAMIPRTNMTVSSDNADFDQILRLFIDNTENEIIVYHKTLDNIIGVIFFQALFERTENVSSLIQPVNYVPENKSCSVLLREFQENNISIAVVLDEFGGTAGVIRMDDLIEEVFGDFYLPGEDVPKIRALNKFTWLLDAWAELNSIEEESGIEFPEGNYETLAGFLLEQIGRIPNEGEVFHFNEFRIEIIEVNQKKILQTKIIKTLVNPGSIH